MKMVEKQKMDWKVWERIGDDDREADVAAMNATDEADRYLDNWGVTAVIPGDQSLVWLQVPMLQFLWGRPWNNMALNYVMGLRPTTIRVSSGTITCDASTWRVTVMLEKDQRTIKNIHQAVHTMGIGCRYGADLKLHREEFRDKPVLEQNDFPPIPRSFVNPKLDLTGRYPCDRPLVSNPPDVEEF
jgi:hypothetical protein